MFTPHSQTHMWASESSFTRTLPFLCRVVFQVPFFCCTFLSLVISVSAQQGLETTPPHPTTTHHHPPPFKEPFSLPKNDLFLEVPARNESALYTLLELCSAARLFQEEAVVHVGRGRRGGELCSLLLARVTAPLRCSL